MNWIPLQDENQLLEINKRSASNPQVIFKHSTRCSISSVVLSRLSKADNQHNIDFYLLDLLKHRNLSDKIAQVFSVYHESPQVLLIKGGECVYDESHSAITYDDIAEHVNL